MAKSKEKKKRRILNARDRLEKHVVGGGGERAINLPEGVKQFKIKEGNYRIDIIPYVAGKGNPVADEGDIYWERTYYTHRGIGPNNDVVICPAKTFSKPCPICEHRAKLLKKGADEDEIKSLKTSERQLFNVIDLNDRKAGIQVWPMSAHLFGKLLEAKLRRAEENEYDNFMSATDGLTLKIGVEENKQGQYTFLEVLDIEFRPRKEQYEEDIVEEAPCLDNLLKEMKYDQLKKLYLMGEDDIDEDDEDEDEDEKKSKKKTKAKSKDDEDEDEDDEDNEDEDDEDDEDEEDKKKSAEKKAVGPAGKLGLKEGMKVKHKKHGVCEITHISGDGTSLRIEDEDGDEHRAIDPKEIKVVEDDDDEDEDEKPAKKGKSAKKPAKKGKPKDDDDEDDDEDEEDDDEDDEDEDEDEDDDEDD